MQLPCGSGKVGNAGASAMREHERCKARDEERIRAKHPKLGGAIVALSAEKQSTRAWKQGAIAEERLGKRLDALSSPTLRVLHDRRIPGSRANIDHIVVTAGGVWVIDTKNYSGAPKLKISGGILRPRSEALMVGRRDCTNLVDGVLGQIEVVRRAVDPSLPITGALCFMDADWPLIGGSFTTRGVRVLRPGRLARELRKTGNGAGVNVEALHEMLAGHFPPA